MKYWLGGDVFLCVWTQHRLKYTILEPAHVKFRVKDLATGKPPYIRVHVGESLESGLKRELNLRLKAAPRTIYVAGPRDESKALRARITGSHHDKWALIWLLVTKRFIQKFCPLVSVGVVY
jgi:hypothetical protein